MDVLVSINRMIIWDKYFQIQQQFQVNDYLKKIGLLVRFHQKDHNKLLQVLFG